MSLANLPPVAPARDYLDAVARFAALAGRETEIISSAGRSRFYGHGERTRDAIVLIHGFTNCPQQWVPFAESLHALGRTVLIPRLPGHGYFNRRTHALAHVSGERLLSTVNEAVDIACGAAERVTVAGLSIGGTIAPWIALNRADVEHAVAIVPFFAVRHFDSAGTVRLARALLTLPNAFVPWDPFGDGAGIPSYGYPRFATRMLGESLDIANEVAAIARKRHPIGREFFGRTTFVLNGHEPACNNDVTILVQEHLERSRPGTTRRIDWNDLPANHDIIDPTNPKARTGLVYPRLLDILTREREAEGR